MSSSWYSSIPIVSLPSKTPNDNLHDGEGFGVFHCDSAAENLEQLVRSYPRYVAGTYELHIKWIYICNHYLNI